MTTIKKKFDNVMDGIDNMLNAAAYDYGLGGYTHRTKEDFRKEFMIKEGQKYIKIGRKSDHIVWPHGSGMGICSQYRYRFKI